MPSRYLPNIKPPVAVVNSILDLLSGFYLMSNELRSAFLEKSFEVSIQKGSYLIKKGEKSRYFYFLVKGIVTGYRIKGNKRLTTFICVDGDFVSAIEGMYGNVPSVDNVIASSDSYLVGLRTEDLLGFYIDFPEMNVIMRKILENYYTIAHERSIMIRMGTAREKYEYYLKSLPGQSDKVPAELVASFLDLKVSTLEKIKKERESSKHESWISEIPKLEYAMMIDKLYQRKRITLKAVALHLNISAHNLSYLLNHHYQKSFSDFVNSFRISFVKAQLKDKNNFQFLTIEALGDQAGFSSKSTFFSAFKKQTGFSPLEFFKNQIAEGG